jgi:hypothetical protein
LEILLSHDELAKNWVSSLLFLPNSRFSVSLGELFDLP